MIGREGDMVAGTQIHRKGGRNGESRMCYTFPVRHSSRALSSVNDEPPVDQMTASSSELRSHCSKGR